jgi:hypothetical protein
VTASTTLPIDLSVTGIIDALRGNVDPRLPPMLHMAFEKERMEAEAHASRVTDALKEFGVPTGVIDALTANAYAAGRLAMVGELLRVGFGGVDPEGGRN